MKERPILFSGEMVRTILEGHKTQTRRVVKFQPLHEGLNFGWSGLEAGHYCTDHPEHGWVLRARRGDGCWEDKTKRIFCPYGNIGDRLWVREAWQLLMPCTVSFGSGEDDWDWESEESDAIYSSKPEIGTLCYKADDPNSCNWWHPSIHMPRWASRITLEITNIRVERVNHITNEDAIAEGVWPPGEPYYDGIGDTPRDSYRVLWDFLNAKRGYSWDSNPWVWVLEFRKV